MKNSLSILIIISMIILMIYFVKVNQSSLAYNTEVGLNISINKDKFYINDKISFEIKIVNNSARKIRILPWMGAYEYNWILISNGNGLKQKTKEKVIYEIDPQYPYKNSYYLIDSHESYILTFNGIIMKDEATGDIFIDFPSSRIYLSNGKYFIQAAFENDEFVIKEAKNKYNFKDLWQGKIVSNTLEFFVEKWTAPLKL